MNENFLAGILGWLFPGAGHAYKGQWNKALLIGITIWLIFAISIWGGSAHYPGFQWDDGPLLLVLNVFARAGNIVGMVISYLIGMNPVKDIAELATFEYSGRLLEIAGILNYIAAIDAGWEHKETEE